MAQIYHGCMTKNADGTNGIIGPGEKFLVPTDECFWKDPRHIKKCKVKTRSCAKKEPIVSIKDWQLYATKGMDRSLDSRFSIKGQLILLLVIVLFVFLQCYLS